MNLATFGEIASFVHPESGLRLACQCSVLGDLKVTKHEGLFGQRTDKSPPG